MHVCSPPSPEERQHNCQNTPEHVHGQILLPKAARNGINTAVSIRGWLAASAPLPPPALFSSCEVHQAPPTYSWDFIEFRGIAGGKRSFV